MKRLISGAYIVIFSFSTLEAQVTLEVVYPKPSQQIPGVDSTFIFGNVTPSARLQINGLDIPVYKTGGWLAYLPVTGGPFIFHLIAYDDSDTMFIDLPIQIGPPDTSLALGRPLIPVVTDPDSQVIYSVGEVFEFSIKGPPGGAAWFHLRKGGDIRMFESPEMPDMPAGNVFGGGRTPAAGNEDYVTYTGRYRLAESDTGRQVIYYKYLPWGSESSYRNPFKSEYMNTDSVLDVIPEFPPMIGQLSGTSQIVRTAPGAGYKLLYQPSGIKVRILGAEDGFYRIALADHVTGYVNIDSIAILPRGTHLPKGKVTFISVDGTRERVVVSAHTGEMFPFEISESSDPSKLDIDIYGVTGDVDWIRYIRKVDFVKLVRWSQPADGIFRITVEFGDSEIGGYRPFYRDGNFIVEISGKPKPRGRMFRPLRGLRIAIDPGHSHDTGTLGPTGLEEADANLWIAHELRKMLEGQGAEVMMTRYGHEDVALYDRPALAEKWGADLLISIHNNALPDGTNPFEHNGTSVYYYHPHSEPLAEAIHKYMIRDTGLRDHGLYYGNLVLTRPTSMPAVLVECAFMMMPEQEAMLRTDKFQRKCARAILRGIKEYLRER